MLGITILILKTKQTSFQKNYYHTGQKRRSEATKNLCGLMVMLLILSCYLLFSSGWTNNQINKGRLTEENQSLIHVHEELTKT